MPKFDNLPTQNLPLVKLYALKRRIMWATSKVHKHILINEFPKSGGTWLGLMLADYFNLPFPRNTLYPKFQRCVMNGHVKYSILHNRPIPLIRDGRDVIVSFYYHFLFKNNWNNDIAVKQQRKALKFEDYHDIKSNLPIFIEYVECVWAKKVGHFSWSEFVDFWLDKQGEENVFTYEALNKNTEDEFCRILRYLNVLPDKKKVKEVVNTFSFKNMYGREPGQEAHNNFARKGIVGDWRNCFTKQAEEKFLRYSGNALISMGYK